MGINDKNDKKVKGKKSDKAKNDKIKPAKLEVVNMNSITSGLFHHSICTSVKKLPTKAATNIKKDNDEKTS